MIELAGTAAAWVHPLWAASHAADRCSGAYCREKASGLRGGAVQHGVWLPEGIGKAPAHLIKGQHLVFPGRPSGAGQGRQPPGAQPGDLRSTVGGILLTRPLSPSASSFK